MMFEFQEFRDLLERVLGLEWNPDLLKMNMRKRPVMTNSAVQVRKPVDFSRVGSWRR
jgi:hypothetical protein